MIQSTENGRASRTEEHMLGHGFYNKHSHEQAKANTYALPADHEGHQPDRSCANRL
jgi:hypothetical protein